MIISGTDIVSMHTLKSWYDNDCIAVVLDNKEEYRMSVKTILQMVNAFEFREKKKRKYKYLENPVCWE